jgi:NitT/TauT family transport system substrate-binding protein
MRVVRVFAVLMAAVLILTLVAGCVQPQVVEKVVTKEVEKIVTVEVEKEVIKEPDIVTIRTNWIFNGIHAFVFYGKQQGFYKDEGIILDIHEGNGSGNVVRTVINKSDDFALVSAEPVFVQMSMGAPLKLIYTWEGAYGYGYLCNPKSNVNKPEDLKGKIIVTSPGAATITIHPMFMEFMGLKDMPDLTLVDPGAATPTVLSGKADCELSGWTDQLPVYRGENVEPTIVKLADYGFGGAVAAMITHQDTIDQKPDLVERMLRATRKAMDACWADKEACVQAELAEHPMMEHDVTFGQLDLDSQLWKSPNMKCNGEIVLKDWQGLYDLMKKIPDSGLEGDQPVESFIDARFVPPCK